MKGLNRLFYDDFSRLCKASITISVGILVATHMLLSSVIKEIHEHSIHERFEDVYASAGGPTLFWIGFIALSAWFILSFYEHYWGSKGIYTLLTLPVSRNALYTSRMLSFVIHVLVLIAAQIVTVYWTYHLWIRRLESLDGDFVMNNGLFLAFIRSDFLRLIFPLSLEGLICSLGLVLVSTTGIFYGILCERSKRYWGFIALGVAGYVTLKAIQSRTAEPLQSPYMSAWSGSVYGLILLAISGLSIWHSLRMIRKGAIAG